VLVKVCGITGVEDARLCVLAGADAIGVNLVHGSKRFVDEATAMEIVHAVKGAVQVVGIVSDRSAAELHALRERLGLHELQLHGDETRDTLAALLPNAYKAVRIGTAADALDAEGWPGETLLVDAKVPGELGGTGKVLDWMLVRALCASRRVLLAGGLTPENVAAAIDACSPYGVDVASGVERTGDPRRKDPEKVRAFVERARGPILRQ
jgi:phosphoribosylanthranilate isomerase